MSHCLNIHNGLAAAGICFKVFNQFAESGRVAKKFI